MKYTAVKKLLTERPNDVFIFTVNNGYKQFVGYPNSVGSSVDISKITCDDATELVCVKTVDPTRGRNGSIPYELWIDPEAISYIGLVDHEYQAKALNMPDEEKGITGYLVRPDNRQFM